MFDLKSLIFHLISVNVTIAFSPIFLFASATRKTGQFVDNIDTDYLIMM